MLILPPDPTASQELFGDAVRQAIEAVQSGDPFSAWVDLAASLASDPTTQRLVDAAYTLYTTAGPDADLWQKGLQKILNQL